jgi:hypothetical protein
MEISSLHPVLIHVPIALGILMPFLFGLLFFLIKRGQLNEQVWFVFWASALVLVVTGGLAFWSGTEQAKFSMGNEEWLTTHQNASFWFFVVSIGIFIAATFQRFVFKMRAWQLELLILALLILNSALVTWAAHFGGLLVYGP